MRITLTGRRLTLAAALVLGGVAAPLAYATIARSGLSSASSVSVPPLANATPTMPRSSASSVSVPPLANATPAMPRASASTGDNPVQVLFDATGQSGNTCFNIPTPPGVDFVLESVMVYRFAGSAPPHVFFWRVLPSLGQIPVFGFNVPITNTTWGSGQQAFNVLIRKTTNNPGDVPGVGICPNGGSFGTEATVILTGQRVVSSPTQATVADFTARSRKGGATLHWKTASETEILGFNVWRYRGAKGVKVNRTLVRAKRSGEPAGASYRYVDQVRGAERGLTYRLQLVDRRGKRTWYAAFAIASK